MKIGFVGLGNMGMPIARNLLRAKHEIVAWNRSKQKAQPLLDAGALPARTPREAAADAELVFSMLADDAALEAVLDGSDGLLAGMRRNALHVSLSTISVATAQRVAVRHREHGQRFVAAPVFGRPEAAAAAKLYVVAGGTAQDVEEAKPALAAISQRVFVVGEKPELASLVKLCGNFMILAAIESMSEALTLAEKGGVARAKLLEILTGTLFDAPVFRNYGAMIAEGRYRPAGFAATLGLKDMRLVGQAAESARVPMPLLSLLRDHLLQTIATEGEDIDWSGIGKTVARNAGL
jgi:3-hydroxyisobutyrate dehydrogenase-like beta-hydroxyacid dehydrogenase